ncbi:hypothetical protein E3U47_19965 [Pseudomonas sp. RIT623]|nr:hypothetical protein E3U47_19965 [Pseudomonas sp. RIT623]
MLRYMAHLLHASVDFHETTKGT